MRAIILAAGQGTRLDPLSQRSPKCLLPLHGRALLEHQLDHLAACGVDDIRIAVGFMGEAVRQAIGARACYRTVPGYAGTNNLNTLHHCRDWLDDDCLVLFADVLIERPALQRLIADERDFALLVDTTCCREGTMRIRLGQRGVEDLGGHIPPADGDGNFIGIAKFSGRGAHALGKQLDAMVRDGGHEQEHYVQALPPLSRRGESIAPVEVGGRWLEIDTKDDYARALAAGFYVLEPGRQSGT